MSGPAKIELPKSCQSRPIYRIASFSSYFAYSSRSIVMPAKAGIQLYQVFLGFTLKGASRFSTGMTKKIMQSWLRLSKAPCINFLKENNFVISLNHETLLFYFSSLSRCCITFRNEYRTKTFLTCRNLYFFYENVLDQYPSLISCIG